MSEPRLITSRQARLALAVGVLADLIQLPLNAALSTVVLAVPAEAVDFLVDAAAALMITRLLGFHWALLPTFAIELVPVIDAAPTWTACVLYVIAQRKKEGRYVSADA